MVFVGFCHYSLYITGVNINWGQNGEIFVIFVVYKNVNYC